MKNKLLLCLLCIITTFNFMACTHDLKEKTEEANCYKMQNGNWDAKNIYLDDGIVEFITTNYKCENSEYSNKLTMSVEGNNNIDDGFYVIVKDSKDNIKDKNGIEIQSKDEIKIINGEVIAETLGKFPDLPAIVVNECDIELIKSEKKENKSNNINIKEEESQHDEVSKNIPQNLNYKSRYGEFKEATTLNNCLVIKFKISPSISNETTIHQNGYNVEDLILNQGADVYNEIQYWAVADMADGSESKVISFTVNKDLINKVKNNQVGGNKIIAYADDVWILPSLQE